MALRMQQIFFHIHLCVDNVIVCILFFFQIQEQIPNTSYNHNWLYGYWEIWKKLFD